MLVDKHAILVGSVYSAYRNHGDPHRVAVKLTGFDQNGACIVEDLMTKEEFKTRQLHYVASIGQDQD